MIIFKLISCPSFQNNEIDQNQPILEPSPQGTRSSEADERREGKVDLPKVQLTQISILGVFPRVHLTFSEGNIRGARSSDPASERSSLSHDKNHFKNIGCGGTTGLNLALNRHTDIIILYTYTCWDHAIWRTK